MQTVETIYGRLGGAAKREPAAQQETAKGRSTGDSAHPHAVGAAPFKLCIHGDFDQRCPLCTAGKSIAQLEEELAQMRERAENAEKEAERWRRTLLPR